MTTGREPAAGLGHAVTRVLISYNSAEVLPYSRLDVAALPTILVDNASRDGSLTAARDLGYRTIEMGYNAGYARAINRGLHEAASEFVLIANPDLRIDLASIEALFDAAKRYSDCDVFVPRLFGPGGNEFFRFESRFETRTKTRTPPKGDACISALSGAALLVRRLPFIEAGAFDEKIFLYFEDDDIALRWRERKKPIVLVYDARAEHLGNKSTASSPRASQIKNRAFGWSWAYIMRKHGLGSVPATLGLTAVKFAMHALTLNLNKARRDADIFRGLLGAVRGGDAPFP